MAIAGAYYVTVSHGLISALFFFVVGMFYERTHTRDLDKLSGMWVTAPVITSVLVFTAMANLGLPTLSGFIGEWYALAGTYESFIGGGVAWVLIGLVLTAVFNLIAIKKVAWGEQRKEWAGIHDITWKERIVFAPLAALIIIFGVWPAPLFNLINPAVTAVAELLKKGGM
jgi:NADH-quinone oxidoreductase subunit M